jgi:hypothetical protein
VAQNLLGPWKTMRFLPVSVVCATHQQRVYRHAEATETRARGVKRNAKGGRYVIMVGGVNVHVINLAT